MKDKDLEKEIAELQKQRALEEGRLASFGTASGDFDNDLYGGTSSRGAYATSISVGGDDDEDDYGHMSEAASSIRKLTGRYTAPKSVYRDIPKNDDEEADPFAEYRKSRISDREDDYKKRRLQRQLSTTGSSYRDRMIETALEREHD
ncbi:U2 snRNP component prp10, putative, partial [Acanthamoeba castellanii str. Neff]